MVEYVAEKTSQSFDPEQYWAPSSHGPWHIILIPLFFGWLVVWMAATFIAGMLWLAREIMQSILRAGSRLPVSVVGRKPWESSR
jgi:hypothetical protein